MSKTFEAIQFLNNSYAPVMENAMSIVRLSEKHCPPIRCRNTGANITLVAKVFKSNTGYPACNADG